jgi:hypothetical protein
MTGQARGRIHYIRDDGTQTGVEEFLVTRHADGRRILRAYCEMWDERVVRDVTQVVDPCYRPLEAYVRVEKAGRMRGSGWFRFSDTLAECDAVTSRDGRVSQRVPLPEPLAAFAAHPVMGDAWQTAAFDPQRGERLQEVFTANSSSEPDGASGPLLGFTRKVIEHLGPEMLEVPAGQFACERFHVHLSVRDWPPLDVWVTGEDHVLVRLTWPVTASRYDLVSFETSAIELPP